jgi:hypothetical protein
MPRPWTVLRLWIIATRGAAQKSVQKNSACYPLKWRGACGDDAFAELLGGRGKK